MAVVVGDMGVGHGRGIADEGEAIVQLDLKLAADPEAGKTFRIRYDFGGEGNSIEPAGPQRAPSTSSGLQRAPQASICSCQRLNPMNGLTLTVVGPPPRVKRLPTSRVP